MRVEISHVLCPVDYSDFSRRALDQAIAVARRYSAHLTVLHVQPVMVMVATEIPGAVAVNLEPGDADAEGHLRAFAAPALDAGIPVSTLVRRGPVAGVIASVADDIAADLVVVGSHGRSGFEHLMLGSVTQRVLHRAACPVLVVPRLATDATAGDGLFRRILCPIDFSEASLCALEYALTLAKSSGGRLALVHALEVLEDEPWFPSSFSVPEYRRLREQDAARRLAHLVPQGPGDVRQPDTLVVTGKAYREILRIAEEREADLIVMGVEGRNPMERVFLGSTTHQVVRRAACPILSVRPWAVRPS